MERILSGSVDPSAYGRAMFIRCLYNLQITAVFSTEEIEFLKVTLMDNMRVYT